MTDALDILLVTRSFHPKISPRSFRSTELACELARQGHNVTVMLPASEFDYSSFAAQQRLTFRFLDPLRFTPIELKGKGPVLLCRRALRRTLKRAIEYPDVELAWRISRALRDEREYDLLISIAAPHPNHWGVAWALKRNPGLTHTWVADCGDPYMGSEANNFQKPFYFKYVEKWFCRMVDHITIPIKAATAGYYPEFHSKISVIPQGFRFDCREGDVMRVQNAVPTFAYAGGFIPRQRDPTPFLEYLSTVSEPFHFVCYTRHVGLIHPFLDRLGNRLDLREYVPRERLLSDLRQMDFLINFENRTTVHSPSKLIDYALTGRPILSIDPFEIDKQKIERFFRGDYRDRFIVPDLERYDIRNVAAQFVELALKRRSDVHGDRPNWRSNTAILASGPSAFVVES